MGRAVNSINISDLAWGTKTAPECICSRDLLLQQRPTGFTRKWMKRNKHEEGKRNVSEWESDLYIKQIELDRVSRVHILVGVEELASEQKGLVLVHPLLSERPAVVQPVHWQHRK